MFCSTSYTFLSVFTLTSLHLSVYKDTGVSFFRDCGAALVRYNSRESLVSLIGLIMCIGHR